MWVIMYGILVDYTHKYLRNWEDTTLKCVRKFATTMIKVFGAEYLRSPSEEDDKAIGGEWSNGGV